MELTPDNITQLLTVLVSTLGGYAIARASVPKAKSSLNGHTDVIVARLRKDLSECEKERDQDRVYFFKELREADSKAPGE